MRSGQGKELGRRATKALSLEGHRDLVGATGSRRVAHLVGVAARGPLAEDVRVGGGQDSRDSDAVTVSELLLFVQSGTFRRCGDSTHLLARGSAGRIELRLHCLRLIRDLKALFEYWDRRFGLPGHS